MTADDRVPFWRGSLQAGHYIFAAALLARLVCLARLSGSPYLRPTGSDMLFYHEWAQRIMHGQLTDHVAFYALPLYAYWLAAVYALCGTSVFVPLLVQAFVDAATAAVIYKLAEVTFPAERTAAGGCNAVGAIAALAWIFYVPAQAYAAVLMPTSFAVFVFWFVTWRIAKAKTWSGRSCFGLSLLVGFAAMAVANVLFAIPLLIFAVWRSAANLSKRWKLVGLIVLGVVTGTAPCWIHNYLLARDPVFLSAHGGVNFWIGNNAGATGYPHFPGLRAGQSEMLDDSIAQAEAAAGHALRRSEVGSYWSSRARRDIRARPAQWLSLIGRKVANWWNAFEYDDVGAIGTLRAAGVLLPGVHFGIVAALALPGVIFAVRNPRARISLYGVLLQMIAVVALFVTERYRTVAVPGLLLFAAFGVVSFVQELAARRLIGVLIYAASAAIATATVTLPREDPSLWAVLAYNVGTQALAGGDLGTADRQLQRAVAYVPHNAETRFALGNLRLAQGNRAAARRSYVETLAIDPHHKGALSNLAVIALDENDPGTAEMYLGIALAQAPKDAKNHYLLARALLGRGDRVGALSELDRAIALAPGQPQFAALRAQIAALP